MGDSGSGWNKARNAVLGDSNEASQAEAQEMVKRADALLAFGSKGAGYFRSLLAKDQHHDIEKYLMEGASPDDDEGNALCQAFLSKLKDMNAHLERSHGKPQMSGAPAGTYSNSFTGSVIEQLQQLKAYCDTRGISQEEFSQLLGPALYPHYTKVQLRTAFMRLDTASAGRLDWQQFSLLLLGDQDFRDGLGQTHLLLDRRPLQYTPTAAANYSIPGAMHKDTICKIDMSSHSDKYYTCGRDHCVKVWNGRTLKYETTLHNSDGVWITDICHMPVSNRLAVCQIDRVVTFYDCQTHDRKVYKGGYYSHGGSKAYMYSEVEVTNMESQSKAKTARLRAGTLDDMSHIAVKSKLLTMNTKVEVIVLQQLLNSPVSMCPYPDRGEYMLMGLDTGAVWMWNFRKEIADDDFSISPLATWKPHTEWVYRIRVAPQITAFMSSSLDGTLQVWDIEKGESITKLKTETGGGGAPQDCLHAFDYNDHFNLLASCGGSNAVLLWSPAVKSPLQRLQEHRAVVLDVAFNQNDWSLITLAEDRVLKVWDVRNFQCLQTIDPKAHGFEDERLGVLFLDNKKGSLLSGEHRPCSFQPKDAPKLSRNVLPAEYCGHRRPVTKVLFTKDFGQMVTTDGDLVLLWDVADQRRVTQWNSDTKIVNLAFDINERQLLSADGTGHLVLWNYVNGAKVKEFTNPRAHEITHIAHVSVAAYNGRFVDQYIVGAGWFDQIVLWKDTPQKPFTEGPHRFLELYGNGDVFSLAYCGAAAALVVGTDKGVLLTYSLVSCSLLYAFAQGAAAPTLPPSVAHAVRPQTEARYPLIPKTGGAAPGSDAAGSAAGLPDAPAHIQALQGKWGSEQVEDLCFLQPQLLAMGMGMGEVSVWRLTQLVVEVVASFWGAHDAGEGVTCMCPDAPEDAGQLAVGDGNGYVSVFDVHGLCGGGPAAAADAVRLAVCWRSSLSAISTILWVAPQHCGPTGCVLTASADCLVRAFSPAGVPLYTLGCSPAPPADTQQASNLKAKRASESFSDASQAPSLAPEAPDLSTSREESGDAGVDEEEADWAQNVRRASHFSKGNLEPEGQVPKSSFLRTRQKSRAVIALTDDGTGSNSDRSLREGELSDDELALQKMNANDDLLYTRMKTCYLASEESAKARPSDVFNKMNYCDLEPNAVATHQFTRTLAELQRTRTDSGPRTLSQTSTRPKWQRDSLSLNVPAPAAREGPAPAAKEGYEPEVTLEDLACWNAVAGPGGAACADDPVQSPSSYSEAEFVSDPKQVHRKKGGKIVAGLAPNTQQSPRPYSHSPAPAMSPLTDTISEAVKTPNTASPLLHFQCAGDTWLPASPASFQSKPSAFDKANAASYAKAQDGAVGWFEKRGGSHPKGPSPDSLPPKHNAKPARRRSKKATGYMAQDTGILKSGAPRSGRPTVAGNAASAIRRLSQARGDVSTMSYRPASESMEMIAGVPASELQGIVDCSAGLVARYAMERKKHPKNVPQSCYSALKLEKPKVISDPRSTFVKVGAPSMYEGIIGALDGDAANSSGQGPG